MLLSFLYLKAGFQSVHGEICRFYIIQCSALTFLQLLLMMSACAVCSPIVWCVGSELKQQDVHVHHLLLCLSWDKCQSKSKMTCTEKFHCFLFRKRLFSMINELPTVFEVVTEKKPVKDKPSVDSGSKSRGSTKVRIISTVFIIWLSWYIFLLGLLGSSI